MMRKVRVVKYGQQPVMSKPGYSRGFNSGQFPIYYPGTEWVKPSTEVSKGLKPVPWNEANVEAEGGETAYIPDQGGLPAHFGINGPRHSEGGVPLNLPPDSFIYSDTKKMKFKGPILEYFGKNKDKSFTPADIAKQYDINKYRKILQNPDSDHIQRHTAELMIKNYNKKLGALALAQEGKKGFPDGVPLAAIPFLMSYAIEPESVLPSMPQQQGMPMMQSPMPGAKKGGTTGTWAAPNYYQVGGGFIAVPDNTFVNPNVVRPEGFYDEMQGTPDYNEVVGNQLVTGLVNQGWGLGNSNIKNAEELYQKAYNRPMKDSDKRAILNREQRKYSVPLNWATGAGILSNYSDYLNALSSNPKVYSKSRKQIGGTYSAQTEPEFGGNWMGKARSKKQYGGEEEQVLQLIQTYAQVTGQDPDQIISQLKQMPAEQAQQALQQMQQTIQQTQNQSDTINGMEYAYGGSYIPKAQYGVGIPGYEYETAPREIRQPTQSEIDFQNSPLGKALYNYNRERPKNMAEAQAQRDSILMAQKAARIAAEKKAKAERQRLNDILSNSVNSTTDSTTVDYTIPSNTPVENLTDNSSDPTATETATEPAPATATNTATTSTAKKSTAANKVTFDPSVKVSDDPVWTAGLELLKKNFGSNEKLKDALYEKWKSRPENKDKNLTRDQVVDNFIKAQEHVYAIQKSLSDADRKSGKWDKGTKKNEVYLKTAQKLGLTPLTEEEIANFQSAYIALNDLNKETTDPEIKATLEKFKINPVGVADEQFGDQKNISKVDSWFGNTTLGQAVLPKLEPKPAPAPEKKESKPLEKATANYVAQPGYAPWWMQDLINIYGSTGDFLRLKKYLPWAPETQPVVPEPVFYDPTRALAANAEQAAIASQAASAFSQPQQLNARIANIQGKAAENAANILGRYESMNVGEANKFEGIKAGIYNQANEMDARRAQDLYDKTTIANQQFDNARAQARQNLRQAYITGITNRAQAQAMNTMYPDYQVDPSTGGFVYYTPGGGGSASNTNSSDFASFYKQFEQNFPNVDSDVRFKEASKQWLDMQEQAPKKRRGNPYGYPGASSGFYSPNLLPVSPMVYPYIPTNGNI